MLNDNDVFFVKTQISIICTLVWLEEQSKFLECPFHMNTSII